MYKQRVFIFLWFYWMLLSANGTPQKIVNIAHPAWGTTVTASSTYSSQHGAYNLTDDRFEKGNSWLSGDNVPYPQTVTFSFDRPYPISLINLINLPGSEACITPGVCIEGSADGEKFTEIASGELPDESNARWSCETGESDTAKFALWSPAVIRLFRVAVWEKCNCWQLCLTKGNRCPTRLARRLTGSHLGDISG